MLSVGAFDCFSKEMEAIYELSSSEKVRSLEEDLRKELKELQNEVEEGNFMTSSVAQKAFGYSIVVIKTQQW